MRILITGGPTHEYLDPVRCLTNPSTGRMGMALARASAKRGHSTVLVTGPTMFPDPKGVKVIRVVSALDMDRAVRREFPKCDVVIGSAAVSDYRPEAAAASKIKKGPATMTLRLVKNPDVLGGCGERKGKRLLVGFALETDCGLENAADKMRRKHLDLVVLNGPESFGANRIGPTFLTPDGKRRAYPPMTKDRLSALIVKFVERAR
jgi:phosphopantothenoylcysteine decarboxylase / phosphopantothenate---cysteine ligase